MIRIFTLAFLLLSSQLSHAQNYSGPESVEFDYARNRYLISNTSSHQIIALQNGVKTIFATLTGTGPHGLEIVGDTNAPVIKLSALILAPLQQYKVSPAISKP